RNAAYAEPTTLEAGEGSPPGDLFHLGAYALQIVLADRLGHVLERRPERLLPWERVPLRFRQEGDLVAGEPGLGQPEVEHIPVDFPPRPDDAAHRPVEPRRAASDLELLTIRQPVALLPEGVVELDAHILELRIEIGTGREVERHAHEVRSPGIEVQRTDDPGL